ncbi:hypothetical protein BDV3_006971 [Batrachochytrium dendrobatidis]|uniref:BSD domain-containing protein n=1 Tax=Batrachochytrium dendrobatidis (strain JEL423) TaxID=403673 RepID=A0A177WSX7_BATDL|nr:RNA polymerase II transcription factor B subunit 1 [Batrachochytrium dendrobatidis]KAK5666038.1 RNA polymerase II transcription factor B subunit 1 [Batrachochytrium dendrobatidis]OAJ42916.1 hypothetical protein BDEG_26308 [Batrachochytrium dendrobatidis JEL423]
MASTASAQVFACPAVYKKKNGVMTVSNSLFSWTETAASSPAISIPYEAIKAQLVNAIGPSGKVLLKLSLWPVGDTPETNHNFSFPNPATAESDRDHIKDYLATRIAAVRQRSATPASAKPTSLPRTASATTSSLTLQDLQARQALLSKNKDLAKLHKEIVIGGLISEQDFWNTRQQTLINQEWQAFQKKGISSGSLADTKPTVDGDGNDLKYKLTPDIIHSIFIEYPAVHKAFQDHVPDKMTEKEFWGKYLASKYFHRNRTTAIKETEDLFDKYMQEDANDLLLNPTGVQFTIHNKLIDLTTTSEDHVETGNRPDSTMRAGFVQTSLPLIRKFNRHSTFILKSSINSKDAEKECTAAQSDLLFQDGTVLEDLEPIKASRLAPLNIQDPASYFDSLTQESSLKTGQTSVSDKQLHTFQSHMQSWSLKISKLSYGTCQSDTIFQAVSELNRKRRNDQLNQQVSRVKHFKHYQETKDIMVSVNELLRHYWSNLNLVKLGEASMKDKVFRIAAALKKYMAQLNVIETQAKLVGEDRGVSLINTASISIEAALKALPSAAR